MATQTYGLTPARIGKYKGDLLKRAEPYEVLSKTGRQVQLPKNNSDTYVARRYLPYGATPTDANTMNRFYQDGNGDRGNGVVQAHQVQEGVTPTPDSIDKVDLTVVIQQYGALYSFTDKTFNFYEDDIPDEMVDILAKRRIFVDEMICWGQIRQCTNQYFGGSGTTVATVNGNITLSMLRKIARNLQANHARPVNKLLKASGDFGTSAVSEGYTVYCHTDLEPDIRDLPNFIPMEKYASGKAMPYEIGSVERFRFITSSDLPSIQNAGAAVGSAPGLQSQGGSNIDVYPFIVTGQDAWSQIAVRGLKAQDPVFMPPSQREKSDPLGQRGYAGMVWWKAVMLDNPGWMAIGNVGIKTLS